MKLFFLFLCLTSTAFAQFANWSVNDDHSEVFFKLSYLGQGEVTGRFKKFSGSLKMDQKIPSAISLSIETDSIDTGNNMRDQHLKSNDFLKSKLHPFITFDSSNIQPIKDKKYWTLGTMNLGGQTRPVKIEFELTDAIQDTWNYYSRFVKWKGKISRKDFNIVWNKTLGENKFLVGDVVSIWGSFQLQPVKGGTPSNKHMIPDTKYIREREKVARGEVSPLEAQKLAPTKHYAPQVLPLATSAPEMVNAVVYEKKGEHSLTWWIWFSVLGMMGFFASIIIGLHSKKFMADNFKYTETGIMGHVSDFITIMFVVIYSVAFWYVGWG